MNRFVSFAGCVVVLAGLLGASSALAGVQVARTIAFAPSAGASDKVKQECQIQTQVPAAIQQAGTDVQLVDQPNKAGRALELTISEVHAPGGGWIGPARSVGLRPTARSDLAHRETRSSDTPQEHSHSQREVEPPMRLA